MLDSEIRPYIDPPLNAAGQMLAAKNIDANVITLAGFVLGLFSFAGLAFELYLPAFVFFVLSRLMDGLDGSVARQSESGPRDAGAYLDIVTDMVFYAGFAFFFAVGRPETSMAAAFLIFSFMGTSSSFLAYAILAAKRGIKTQTHGKKSFYYAAGLCEGTETLITFTLICLLPDFFMLFAVIFGMMCWITTIGRTAQAVKEFG